LRDRVQTLTRCPRDGRHTARFSFSFVTAAVSAGCLGLSAGGSDAPSAEELLVKAIEEEGFEDIHGEFYVETQGVTEPRSA